MKFSDIIKQINKNYQKDLLLVKKFSDGFRNAVFQVRDKNLKEFVLIVYKSETDILKTIENAHAVAKFLKDKGLPVRLPISSLKGEEILKFKTRYLALYNFLSGNSIPWESYERRHLKMMGKTLSDIHFYLKDYSNDNLPRLSELLHEEIIGMKDYFEKVEPWINRKLNVQLNWEKINSLFKFVDSYSSMNSQAMHFDFVRGNVLFSTSKGDDELAEISGILDFEKVCHGPLVCDVARTLSFLIVDCKYKTETEVVKWFLDRGYAKRGLNKPNFSKAHLSRFIEYFWIRDFWKFLLHNPYEYLNQNQHYIRTMEQLLKYAYCK